MKRHRQLLTVYRIIGTDRIDDPSFLDSLRSHYELSEEPRKIERTSTVIHMGISGSSIAAWLRAWLVARSMTG